MIHRTKQTWEVGQTVQVGLTVHSFIPKTDKTLNDTFPYGLLMGLNGKSYLFRPHCGIARI